MELKVAERLNALQILPKEGSYITLKVQRGLQEKLGFDSKELEELEIKQDEETGLVTWNKEKDEPVKFEFDLKEIELISDVLKELDKEKKLSTNHFSLYEKFVK